MEHFTILARIAGSEPGRARNIAATHTKISAVNLVSNSMSCNGLLIVFFLGMRNVFRVKLSKCNEYFLEMNIMILFEFQIAKGI